MKTFKFSLVLRTRENTDVFISLDDSIYGIHSKRINILYVVNKYKSKNFQASKLSTYDFSTLYTTLPHHLIKDKLIDLIN